MSFFEPVHSLRKKEVFKSADVTFCLGILTPGEPARQPVKQATNANSRYGTVASPRVNTPQAQPEEFGIANTPPNVPSYNWDSKEIPADQPSPVGNRDRDYLRPTSPNAAEPLPQTAQTADWQMVAKPAPECPSAQRCLDTIEKNAMVKFPHCASVELEDGILGRD